MPVPEAGALSPTSAPLMMNPTTLLTPIEGGPSRRSVAEGSAGQAENWPRAERSDKYLRRPPSTGQIDSTRIVSRDRIRRRHSRSWRPQGGRRRPAKCSTGTLLEGPARAPGRSNKRLLIHGADESVKSGRRPADRFEANDCLQVEKRN